MWRVIVLEIGKDRIRKVIRHRRTVLPELGINEIGSDYLPFWRDKRTRFGYFKLAEMVLQ
jgi:hypothetical protein